MNKNVIKLYSTLPCHWKLMKMRRTLKPSTLNSIKNILIKVEVLSRLLKVYWSFFSWKPSNYPDWEMVLCSASRCCDHKKLCPHLLISSVSHFTNPQKKALRFGFIGWWALKKGRIFNMRHREADNRGWEALNGGIWQYVCRRDNEANVCRLVNRCNQSSLFSTIIQFSPGMRCMCDQNCKFYPNTDAKMKHHAREMGLSKWKARLVFSPDFHS